MDDTQFQGWMRRLADANESAPAPTANAIRMRARLRRRLYAEERVTLPIRMAERAAGIWCWLLTAAISASMGTWALAAWLAISLAILAGLGVIALQKT
jgi:hypothetical protein